MFRGFKIDLPSYSVICPQSGFTFNTRSLRVSEVSKLKGSLITPSKAPALVNKTIWDSLEDKPDFIETYNDFKKMITMKDREALLYGCYHATFGDTNEFTTNCQSCSNSETLKLSLSKIFSMVPYPGSESIQKSYKVARAISTEETPVNPDIEKSIKDRERDKITSLDDTPEDLRKHLAKDAPDPPDKVVSLGKKPEAKKIESEPVLDEGVFIPDLSILKKTLILKLPISGIEAHIKQPTIADEERIMDDFGFSTKKNTDLVQETLVIDRLEQRDESGRVVNSAIAREDILLGYQQLPQRDKTEIFDKFQDEFGKYGIELKSSFICGNCSFENEIELDMVIQFFRMVGLS